MTLARIAAAASVLVFLLVLAYALVYLGISGPPAKTKINVLGENYLRLGYNPWTRNLTAMSPEILGGILWDYRGLDTFYETMVLLAAVLGGLMLYRELGVGEKRGGATGPSLSIVIDGVSRIVLWLTAITAFAMGLTGQLTPGGGFIGGAAFAVIPVLAILAYHPGFIEGLGLTRRRAVAIRASALALLAAVAVLPLLLGGYVFQNQWKPGTRFSYPSYFPDGTPMAGSVFLLNTVELFAVLAAFTLSFIVLAYITVAEPLGDKSG